MDDYIYINGQWHVEDEKYYNGLRPLSEYEIQELVYDE